jgi:hypothetical protein
VRLEEFSVQARVGPLASCVVGHLLDLMPVANTRFLQDFESTVEVG